jgi:hypothetical protein
VDSGKIGIPGPILRQKQKMRILLSGLITLMIIIITIPALYLIKHKPVIVIQNNENVRERIFLADISSDYEETRFESIVDPLLEPIHSQLINKINEIYYSLLKTNFIADYDIGTEADLRREYAKRGLAIPEGDQPIIKFPDSTKWKLPVAIIRPYLFEYKDGGKYHLLVDYSLHFTQSKYKSGIEYTESCKVSQVYTLNLTDIDSVPYYINARSHLILYEHNKSLYSKGTIIKIDNDDVIIEFIVPGNNKKPIPGLIYMASRHYEPWTSITDSGVRRRLNDLDKLLKYYGTIDEWIKEIDTSDRSIWSYSEYIDLRNTERKFGGETSVSFSIPVELELIEVFDSTALAKIHYREYPWVELEVGDEVELK